jgi:TonB family protein
MTSLITKFSLVLMLTGIATAQLSVETVRVSSEVMQTHLIDKVQPEYPPGGARVHGNVVLNILIDKRGNVVRARLVSGHPMLVQSAIDAVKRWKYKPYLLNGLPVKVETLAIVNFVPINSSAQGVVGDHPGGIPPGEPGGIAPSTLPPTPPAPVPNRVRVAPTFAEKRLIFAAPPVYPAEARNKHIEGQVILHVIIDKKGNISRALLISGHPMLAPAAIDAVKQWKYTPYLLNNQPVEVETQVTVTFSLKP